MVDFQAKKEAFIKATPEALFKIVADFTKHNELAGSGEIVTIRQVTDGPVGFGTTLEATEKLPVGDQVMDAVARSVVVTHEPPNDISWISSPVVMPIRRIQWWFHFDNFHLTPQGEGTNVVHQVEVDFGPQTDPQMIGLKENYDKIRAPYVLTGMDKTMENLRRFAEK